MTVPAPVMAAGTWANNAELIRDAVVPLVGHHRPLRSRLRGMERTDDGRANLGGANCDRCTVPPSGWTVNTTTWRMERQR